MKSKPPFGSLRVVVLVALALTGCESPAGPQPLVEMPALEPGRVVLRITAGSRVKTASWSGEFQRDDVLWPGGPEGYQDLTFLEARSEGVARDSAFVLYRDGYLYTQRWDIGPLLSPAGASAPVAYLLISEDDEIVEIWASIAAGVLELVATLPPRPGLDLGSGDGTMTGPLVRLDIDGQGFASYSEDTIQVEAAFDLDYRHVLRPFIELGLEGGVLSGSANTSTGIAYGDGDDGLIIDTYANFDEEVELFDVRLVMRVDTVPLTLNVGENRLFDAIAPEQYRDPQRWPGAFAAVTYRTTGDVLLNQAGEEMGIGGYTPATERYFGRIDVLLNRQFRRYGPYNEALGEVSLYTRMHIPISPGTSDPRRVPARAGAGETRFTPIGRSGEIRW